MMLLFSNTRSSRLEYIASFLFKEVLQLDISFTNNIEDVQSFSGKKIVYAPDITINGAVHIIPHELLFEDDIKQQTISIFQHKKNIAFFKTEGDHAFDILAASFYLLSRYEEYLPHQKDMYHRYAHENSLACKENFLHLPLINIWLHDFAMQHWGISSTYTSLFIPTYDIDIAYSYKGKGWLRNIGGFIKSPSLQRVQTILGKRKDPFDCYDELDALHRQYSLQPLYFFLMANKNGKYDKNILPHKPEQQGIVKKIASQYNLGIHPSWASYLNASVIEEEIKTLEAISSKKITSSRQHYIYFNLPEGYQLLLDCGITDDYSMGYGSINGFRASTGSSFFWFDLKQNQQTTLRVHPFCFMEANSLYEQRYTPQQALEELKTYHTVCREYNCDCVTVWHNHLLGIPTWMEMYRSFLAQR